MNQAGAPGLVIAAPASGSGKTVVTLGLLSHLAKMGRRVVSAKAGPDYIDPAFHAAATGQACLNLDPWAMREATLGRAAAWLAQDADIVVCEGVMGLFDGAFVNKGGNDGSTAALAQVTGWPVVLVIDAHAQAASAAAVAKGFATFRPGVEVGGIVFNRIGGERHGEILRQASKAALPDIPVLGCLPRTDGLALPARHLGLVQAAEHPDLSGFIARARALIAEHLDTDALVALARPLKAESSSPGPSLSPPLNPIGQRIAVARDEAFGFSYPLVIEGWREAGAEIALFSPLEDESPAEDADAVYLPGGYPELHAGRVAQAGAFLAGLRAAAGRGAAVFGECGGYMVLGGGLVDADAQRHAMAGLLALETSFAQPALHLGYRRARLAGAGPLGALGEGFRGHEFHYATILEEGPGEPLFRAADAEGRDIGAAGLRAGSVAGSFIHLIDREEP